MSGHLQGPKKSRSRLVGDKLNLQEKEEIRKVIKENLRMT